MVSYGEQVSLICLSCGAPMKALGMWPRALGLGTTDLTIVSRFFCKPCQKSVAVSEPDYELVHRADDRYDMRKIA